MAAACIGRWKIIPTLARTITRRWDTTTVAAAAEKMKYINPHPRRYGTSPLSATDMQKLSRSTGNHNYDLAVNKAVQHYYNHIKVEEEDGPSTMMYPLKGASDYIRGVEMFHILLKTIGGQKYISIYVAPHIINRPNQLDARALNLVLFSKLDINVPLPFHSVVGQIKQPVSPRNHPLIVAAARFALSQHNKEGKLARQIIATSQMVGEHEILRMSFKVESDSSTTYDAIVLVPRKTPEKMMLVMINGRPRGSRNSVPDTAVPVIRYEYSDSDAYEDECYEDDRCVSDDPRVLAAARFSLAQFNEEGQVRRVVEATRRTYSGDEILSVEFDDGSRSYKKAIVLVPVNNPGNMRLAYFGPNKCSVDDPRVTEVFRVAIAPHLKKLDEVVRVVEATSEHDSVGVTYRVTFIVEKRPFRRYVAKVLVPVEDPQHMKLITRVGGVKFRRFGVFGVRHKMVKYYSCRG